MVIVLGGVAILLAAVIVRSALRPAVRGLDERVLREYAGVYQWDPNAFVYLQMWNEFAGFENSGELVAFDESGRVRTLYATPVEDRFFTGPGAALPTATESRVDFQRDSKGTIVALSWQRLGDSPRIARRVAIEQQEDVQFSNGPVRLAGRLIRPIEETKYPAIVLVHGSGAENREYLLPFARFLIRRGVAVFGYDKRGVGGSTGSWNAASFDDLAGDVVAAVRYLKTRSDIDGGQIGLLGVSQAGWIMPLAALRVPDLACLISVSGAGVPGAETMVDHARNEMTAAGMRPQMVEEIIGLMNQQFEFARTGQGWEAYLATRERLGAQRSPDTFPATRDHPYWNSVRMALYDPAPTLQKLTVPTLALFGELDNNILADKNRAAWEAALKTAGHRDYTLRILPKANHYQWEAKLGTNAELASLQGFVPAYFATVAEWLLPRLFAPRSGPGRETK